MFVFSYISLGSLYHYFSLYFFIFPAFVTKEVLFSAPCAPASNRETSRCLRSWSGSNFRDLMERCLPAAFQTHLPALRPGPFANVASLLCLSRAARIESLTSESYFSVKFNLFTLAAFLVHFCKSMKWGLNQRITRWMLINCNESPFGRKKKRKACWKIELLGVGAKERESSVV